MDPDLIGKTIAEKYLIKRRIGEGGMGAVYEGEHVEIGKRVAIKVINAMHSGSQEVAERFRREARAASKIESENIVHVFDVGRDPVAGLYMVMEYLVGEDLSQRLEQVNLLDPSLAVSIAHQACRALAKAHDVGVIHRDLKPANLFLIQRDDGSVQVKILDFGISKLTKDARQAKASEPPLANEAPKPLTRAGVVIGTAQYMSPEQAQGQPVDLRTDVWSLGAVLYEALAGRPVCPELESYEMTIIQIVTQPVPRLADVASWVPADLAALVHEALEPDLQRRLPDCRAFARRLAQIAPSLGITDAFGALSSANFPPLSESDASGRLGAAGQRLQILTPSPNGGRGSFEAAETKGFDSSPPARAKGRPAQTGQGLALVSNTSPGTSRARRARWASLGILALIAAGAGVLGVRLLAGTHGTEGAAASPPPPTTKAGPEQPSTVSAAPTAAPTEPASAAASAGASAAPAAVTSSASAVAPVASASAAPSATAKVANRRPTKPAAPSAPTSNASQVGGAGLGTQY